jgi:hypothetical protein
MSYNIFSSLNKWGPRWYVLSLSRRTAAAGPVHADSGRPGNPLEIADVGSFYRIEERVAYPGAAFFTL